MFDGMFLNKIKNELNILKTGRISKINESGDTDFVFTIRAQRANFNLMLSFSSNFSRIHLTNKEYNFPQNPKSFTMFLRKHLMGLFISDIYTYSSDRIIIFKLEGYDEMQDYSIKYLICEIMGRYSNMIITDKDYVILDALKHDGIGEYNRTILPHAKYEYPLNPKLNPFDYSLDELGNIIKENNIVSPKDYMNVFAGVSLNTLNHIYKNDNHTLNFYNAIHADIKPCVIINQKDKLDFYYNPFDFELKESYESLSALLDEFYYKADLEAKIKQKTDDLSTFINREINKFEKKIDKLNKELNDTSDKDMFKLYGELLLSYRNLKEKNQFVEVLNYYNNEIVKIPLDNKYTILDNSNKYYKKYQKAKNAVTYINEQIKIASDELIYFKELRSQLDHSNINDALEIQDELIKNKYLLKNIKENKKKQKPKLLTYILDDTLICVGKNNIQNDYLTHQFAKPSYMWFHVKDNPGSHVVVCKDTDLTESEIRCAANLAAYYSSLEDSSSAPVDYTKVKNIKKIPGRKGSNVTYTHQKTIYIDPSYDEIKNLEIKK